MSKLLDNNDEKDDNQRLSLGSFIGDQDSYFHHDLANNGVSLNQYPSLYDSDANFGADQVATLALNNSIAPSIGNIHLASELEPTFLGLQNEQNQIDRITEELEELKKASKDGDEVGKVVEELTKGLAELKQAFSPERFEQQYGKVFSDPARYIHALFLPDLYSRLQTPTKEWFLSKYKNKAIYPKCTICGSEMRVARSKESKISMYEQLVNIIEAQRKSIFKKCKNGHPFRFLFDGNNLVIFSTEKQKEG